MLIDEVMKVHETTLHILEHIGVRLEHDEVVSRVLKSGAQLGPDPYIIRFPREMVMEYLSLAPSSAVLAGRDDSKCILTCNADPIFWTNPAMYMWDGQTRRRVMTQDLVDVARLCNQLPNVSGIMGMALADVPASYSDFTGLRIMAENTLKHIRVLCASTAGAEALRAMQHVFDGPWFSVGFTAHGPLRWTHLALEIFLRTAGLGIPATVNGEPMAGVTGPVTLAGSIAVGNAEIVAGIVVNQILEPGRPLVYNLGLAHVMDMKHATTVTGGPENALFANASAALGRFYQIPSGSWVSTDSVYEDQQAALEKMFGFTTHITDGVSLIWGLGQLESALTMSLGQLVIDNEMINYIRHYRRGLQFGNEELALDLIKTVGIAGNYLDTEHTYSHFRNELYMPDLLNRSPREMALSPLPDCARQRASTLLANDQVINAPTNEIYELRKIENFYRNQTP